MPANLDGSTQRIILVVSTFTTFAIAIPALYAQLVMLPKFQRRLSSGNISSQKSNPSLFVGCLSTVAIMILATILIILPILSLSNEAVQDKQNLSSSINFCEQDFLHSPYIAEPANVVSSLTCYVPLALFGLFGRPSTHCRHSKRFVVIYTTLLAIGIGSMALHALLTAKSQGGDELPMLWFTAATAYCALDLILQRNSRLLAALVAGSAVAATVTYIAGRHDFTTFYALFSLYSQIMTVSILYITFGIDWETRSSGMSGIQFKADVLYPLAIATGWSTILAIWVWVSEMIFCNAVVHDKVLGEGWAPFVWNRVVHPMWHFWSGLLAWLLVQVLLAAHGMQQGWGVPTLQWFGAPYVMFQTTSTLADKKLR